MDSDMHGRIKFSNRLVLSFTLDRLLGMRKFGIGFQLIFPDSFGAYHVGVGM